jgi:hypothetical protein
LHSWNNSADHAQHEPILPEWACRLRVRYTKPLLRDNAVVNLLAAAGVIVGVGDFRQEKGKGSFGQFELVSADNPDFVRIVSEQGIAVQDDALANPVAHDEDTEKLWAWFDVEVAQFRESKQAKKKAA